jgi:ATP-dependent DNA helicase RecQ
MAIKAARDRGWESYRSIERFSADGQTCRRRQILDHFGDRAQGAPTGRCCDVCDRDLTLEQAIRAVPVSARRTRGSAGAEGRAMAQGVDEPVDRREFDALRAWRKGRAEGRPAFTVTTDTVLRTLLAERPRSVRELLEIKGIGKAFCDKHGQSLLAELTALR